MYVPPAFAEHDSSQIAQFVHDHNFGILVSHQQGEMQASHLPFLLEADESGIHRLLGHLAAANPQCRDFDGQKVLVIFPGTHAYISPRWYQEENTVPTWNYVAVHVQGIVRVMQDPEQLTQLIAALTVRHEGTGEDAWQFEPGSEFSQRLLSLVVGFAIEVTSIEGKWKLSQNHSRQRRERVIEALNEQGDAQSIAIAQLMTETLR